MSRGNPLTVVRLKRDILVKIDKEVSVHNEALPGMGWTRSSWIREAIHEKLIRAERQRHGWGDRPGRRKRV